MTDHLLIARALIEDRHREVMEATALAELLRHVPTRPRRWRLLALAQRDRLAAAPRLALR